MLEKVKSFIGRTSTKAVVVGGAVLSAGKVLAEDATVVTLPTNPVDTSGLATAGLGQLGTVIAGCAGVLIVLTIIGIGIRKTVHALKGWS